MTAKRQGKEKRRGIFSQTARRCLESTLGPVSGLISGVCLNHRLPMQKTQWLDDDSLLIYRCGGSVGFGNQYLTDFPFNPMI
jgi:hypothetical protein